MKKPKPANDNLSKGALAWIKDGKEAGVAVAGAIAAFAVVSGFVYAFFPDTRAIFDGYLKEFINKFK